jgi:very-short-patch-repair endonuclease
MQDCGVYNLNAYPVNHSHLCLECGASLSEGVYTYSIDTYSFPLCQAHQRWLDGARTTEEAIKLYFALKLSNIQAELEYHDGHKTVDIAVPGKLYIEVDGPYHNDSDQALTDLLRSFYSLKDGIATVRIPNELINSHYEFNLILDRLVEICTDLKKTG